MRNLFSADIKVAVIAPPRFTDNFPIYNPYICTRWTGQRRTPTQQVPLQGNRPSAGATAAGARLSQDDPQETRAATPSADNGGNPNAPLEGFICPDCRESFLAADALIAHFGSVHANAGSGKGGGGGAGNSRRGEMAGGGGETRGLGGEDSRIRGNGVREGSDRVVPLGPSPQDQLFGTKRSQNGATPGGRQAAAAGEGNGVIAEQKAVMASQEAYLDSVGEAVRELGQLGRNIGASLDGQGAALERVVEKTTDAEDRTAFVTRKAARQAQSSKPKKPTFVMSVALQVRGGEREKGSDQEEGDTRAALYAFNSQWVKSS